MRLRPVYVAIAALLLGRSAPAAVVDAASEPPTCFGKTATQWLTSPGTLTGTSGDDVLVGSNGDDTIDLAFTGVSGGVDFVCAGGGDDYVTVSGDDSRADGGSGEDIMSAQFGAYVNGGSGNDYRMSAFGDGAVADGGSGNDEVNGYEGGTAKGAAATISFLRLMTPTVRSTEAAATTISSCISTTDRLRWTAARASIPTNPTAAASSTARARARTPCQLGNRTFQEPRRESHQLG